MISAATAHLEVDDTIRYTGLGVECLCKPGPDVKRFLFVELVFRQRVRRQQTRKVATTTTNNKKQQATRNRRGPPGNGFD